MRGMVLPAVFFAALFGVSAFAQEVTPLPGKAGKGTGEGAARDGGTLPVPGLVGKLRERGARVSALGDRGGLSGWLVEPARGDAYTLYVAPDGHAVAGLMYDPDGMLATRGQLEGAGRGPAAAPERRSAVREALESGRRRAEGKRFTELATRPRVEGKPAPAGLFATSAEAFGFTLGHRGRTVLAFADPGCRWSREAVEALGREAVAGRFRLRVIPVGLLGAESARAAVRIASSPDPALAWFGREMADVHRAGGMWVEESNAVFERWGENAVPLIAWPGRGGGHVYAVGSIADVPAWVEEAFGP